MRILITGIHGFVGNNLVKALKTEHIIYGLDIISPYKEGVRGTFSWNLLDKEGDIPEVDAIIHLAGKAHDTKKTTSAEVYFKVNRDLTIKIFDYFHHHKNIKKFVFFSTAKAASDMVDGILTEDVVPAPVGPYGVSKIAAENYIQDVINNHPRDFSNRGIYIFRPCMIHGPGNKGNLNLLYNMVKKGFPWPLGAFDNKRTFTSIDNICFAVNGVLTKDVPSGIYNMGDDEALSTNELIHIICQATGKKGHILKVPKCIMSVCARIGDVFNLPLNTERMKKLTENYISSNLKIKKALGIKAFPIDARSGLIKTIKSFECNKE